jgi:dihydropteroate synthase
MSEYYRPIPCETGRWLLAGGWLRFSQFELLRRGAAPRIVDHAPDEVLAALTAPRAPCWGLAWTSRASWAS